MRKTYKRWLAAVLCLVAPMLTRRMQKRKLFMILCGLDVAVRVVMWFTGYQHTALLFILLGLSTQAPFTFEAFLAGAFINALPGILLQLFLIPTLVLALGRTGLMQADG